MSDWESFAGRLAAAFAVLDEGTVVLIKEDGEPGSAHYVQFTQRSDRLEVELVDDGWLDKESQAGEAGTAAITALGWSAPGSAHENWWVDLLWPALSVDYRRIADMAVGGLRDGYRVHGPQSLSYQAWNDVTNERCVVVDLGLPRGAS